MAGADWIVKRLGGIEIRGVECEVFTRKLTGHLKVVLVFVASNCLH